MEQQQPSNDDSPPLYGQRLDHLVVFAYRSQVLHRLAVTAEWRGLDWTDDAACAGHAAATPRLCGRCPVVAPCLAAALASNDRAAWRGGLHRSDRDCLWAGLERTYRDVRDLELMRFDVARLPRRDVAARPDEYARNGHRS